MDKTDTLNDYIDEALVSALPLDALEKLEKLEEDDQVNEDAIAELLKEYDVDPDKVIDEAKENFEKDQEGVENA